MGGVERGTIPKQFMREREDYIRGTIQISWLQYYYILIQQRKKNVFAENAYALNC